jgi:hypothetical protein
MNGFETKNALQTGATRVAGRWVVAMLSIAPLLTITGEARAGSTIYAGSFGELENRSTLDEQTGQWLFTQSFWTFQGGLIGINDWLNPKWTDVWSYSAAMDFSLASIPPGYLPSSVILSLYVTYADLNSVPSPPMGLGMTLYAGSGQVTVADFSAPNIGTYTALNSPFGTPPNANYNMYMYPLNFDVTSFVNTLLQNGDQYAGLVLFTNVDVQSLGPSDISFANETYGVLQPTLFVNEPPLFSGPFPEPSSWVLLGTGIGAGVLCPGLRRRGGSTTPVRTRRERR